MVSTRASLVLFSCLVLYSVQYATALQCYTCMSEKNDNSDCYKNPKQPKYLLNCMLPPGSTADDQNTFGRLTNSTEMKTFLYETFRRDSAFPHQFECTTVEGNFTIMGTMSVFRGCTIKETNCDGLKQLMKNGKKFQIDSCNTCSGDACNSSDAMKAGIWSLVISVAMLFYVKY